MAIGLGTVFLYHLQRALSKSDLSGIRDVSWAVWLIGVISSLLCVFYLNFAALVLMAICGVVGVIYAYPVFKSRGRRAALRDLPYLKIWTIAFVWLAVCLWVPRLDVGQPILESRFLLHSFGLVTFIIALTIPFDIRDSKSDNPNLRTLPMLLGHQRAMLLARSLILVSLGTWMFLTPSDTPKLGLILELLAFVYAYVILRVDEKRLKHYHLLYVDGALLVLGLSMVLTP